MEWGGWVEGWGPMLVGPQDNACFECQGLRRRHPRPTYCCNDKDGLPGGSTILTVQLKDIWQYMSAALHELLARLP